LPIQVVCNMLEWRECRNWNRLAVGDPWSTNSNERSTGNQYRVIVFGSHTDIETGPTRIARQLSSNNWWSEFKSTEYISTSLISVCIILCMHMSVQNLEHGKACCTLLLEIEYWLGFWIPRLFEMWAYAESRLGYIPLKWYIMDEYCKDIRTFVSRNPQGWILSRSTTISSRNKEETQLADCTNQKRPGIFDVQNGMDWTTRDMNCKGQLIRLMI